MTPHLAPNHSPQKANYTNSDKAFYLLRGGRRMAGLYEQSALLKKDARAIATADLLRETYRPNNIYLAEDLINYQTGELFEGYGSLANGVNSRCSKVYLTASARRTRKKILGKLSEFKLYVGERCRFLTLTMPFLKADFATVLKIEDRAITLLKKRKLWTSNVRAGFLSEEVVIGDSTTPTQTHYHAHIHALVVSKYIQRELIADAWTDCVEKACAQFGVEFLMRNLVSNRLSVDIRDVERHAKRKEMALEDAINELCKYVVKGSDYDKVPVAELVDIDRALFKRQMVKSYGEFNQQKGKSKHEPPAQDTSVHTKRITDGKVKFKAQRPRRPSLIETGEKLIREGRRTEWRRMIQMVMEDRRAFRVEQLARKFPHAKFRTLDGGRWYGVAERAPQTVIKLDAYKAQRSRDARANYSTSDNDNVSPYPRIL